MADNRLIGLFDSGVGGLSIFMAIKKLLPRESFIFLADQGHNPYGEKTPSELKSLSARITRFLLSKKIKLLVVACNTATCYALNYLRSKFALPIVGVVPAIKPAVKLTKNGKIAIFSTPATAKSTYLANLTSDVVPSGFRVLKLGCDGLEEAIEYLEVEKIDELLNIYPEQAKRINADVVVLGCTHYPFIKGKIQKKVGRGVKIIDSGQSIAKRVKFLLKQKDAFSHKKSRELFFTTADPAAFSKVASTLLKYKVSAQKAII